VLACVLLQSKSANHESVLHLLMPGSLPASEPETTAAPVTSGVRSARHPI